MADFSPGAKSSFYTLNFLYRVSVELMRLKGTKSQHNGMKSEIK